MQIPKELNVCPKHKKPFDLQLKFFPKKFRKYDMCGNIFQDCYYVFNNETQRIENLKEIIEGNYENKFARHLDMYHLDSSRDSYHKNPHGKRNKKVNKRSR